MTNFPEFKWKLDSLMSQSWITRFDYKSTDFANLEKSYKKSVWLNSFLKSLSMTFEPECMSWSGLRYYVCL